MIDGRRVVFPREKTAEVQPYAFNDENLEPDEIALETVCSAISSGTELAGFTNDQDLNHWHGNPYPYYPGYAAVGSVVKRGDAVTEVGVGDLVFAPFGHASHHRVNVKRHIIVRVPEHVPPEDAVYARLCSVGMTTLRTTVARPGDGVAVFGLGVVGTMASLVFQASGYEVAAIDPLEGRRKQAEGCGIRQTLAPGDDLAERWNATMSGVPCRLAIDTSGSSHGVQAAIHLAAMKAEIVLIGAHWKKDHAHSTSDLLQTVFSKYLTLRSGWEWEIPNLPTQFSNGSIKGNQQHALNLMARGEIRVGGVRSHLLPPEQAHEAYMGLLNDKERYTSVVLDWR
ncbi:MAG: zinc-binding alcohol dehydrogenase [Candidatus Poribacteria bacterium]|nr:zinc-binding alcohol dehydrogenase [Candidatus Poribacteria bacterium]